ncbi:BMP family protein [Nocardioides sp. zg-1228]|uniref:BMP family lipoprotein n=1 Tax=Nocardioides sp. zg-1228 TaxID=2763008 RepID=UPI001642AB7E|nr:BMP family ABC transporter substrate-binding protein [Nocardioides sp. zg-1228]MBC2933751.1 BMP family ABC transporter substrate-binding protein [Nocardioides sp. zg-1228]QSF58529.1 BMP family ABC transporter substrate-binding protein [Nocardioides sp. zg-1228]
MNKSRKVVSSGLVALLAAATLAACGDAPEEETTGGGSGSSEAAASDFTPCIVSDAGGFDDKSFNQLGYEGAKQAADELGVELIDVESNSENDYGPNLESLIGEGCDVIVTVGFALAAATKESAAANPDVEYVLIDDSADGGDDGATFDGKADEKNIKPLLYNTAEAAFLAGYAAADYTKTGKVGTFGGMPFPTVTIFMDGFKQGAEYYAKEKGKDVEVVGWDGKNGSFTGGFEANEAATSTAKQILDQDVDVILPVGGPIYQGAITAIEDSGKDVAMVGVDADLYETDPNTQDYVMTSILKDMKVSTYEAVMAAGQDEFDFEPYIGTLENGGVSIAGFHNFEDKVSDELAAELDEVKAGIVDGSIKVKSYLG